jgi:serine/threonine protein kinase
VVRLLGEGGMGAVYAAEHLLLGRMAAVKVLLPEHSASSVTVTRFFNEARAATAIRHLGIVEIYDFGYAPDGSAYIAMELLEGQSLAARMRAGISRASDALAIARQIAGALAAAHAKSIVHRDLKPDNIFLIADAEVAGGERIKLLDFGIAKLQEVSASGAGVTNTGAVMGTPTYMAPEQCRGVSVDHRVDLYAVGCILYEMLGGAPPFSGEGAGDVLAAHIHVPPPSLRARVPALNAEVEALVQHLLAKDPARRVQSATALIAEIDRVASQLGDEPRPVTRPGSIRPVSAALTTLSAATASAPARERRRVGIWLGVAAATLAAGLAVVAITSRDEAIHPPSPRLRSPARRSPRPRCRVDRSQRAVSRPGAGGRRCAGRRRGAAHGGRTGGGRGRRDRTRQRARGSGRDRRRGHPRPDAVPRRAAAGRGGASGEAATARLCRAHTRDGRLESDPRGRAPDAFAPAFDQERQERQSVLRSPCVVYCRSSSRLVCWPMRP